MISPPYAVSNPYEWKGIPRLKVPAAVAAAPLSETVALSTGAASSTKLVDSQGKSLKRWQGIHASVKGLTWTGTVTDILLRVTTAGVVQSGASDYKYAGLWRDAQVAVSGDQVASGVRLAAYNTSNMNLVFGVYNLGLAVPTGIEAWEINPAHTDNWQWAGTRDAAEENDGISLVLIGTTPVITGGTMYLGYY